MKNISWVEQGENIVFTKKTVNIYDFVCLIFALFSVITLSYTLIDRFMPVNRILGGFLFILLFFLYVPRLNIREIVILCIALFLFFRNLMLTETYLAESIENSIYWVGTIMLLTKLSNNDNYLLLTEAFRRKSRLIRITILFDEVIVIAGFFVDSCYVTKWGGVYYRGFAISSHTLCCGCCLGMCLSLLLMGRIQNCFIRIALFVPFTIAILQSGARTYFIPILCLYYVAYKLFFQKTTDKIALIPIWIIAGIGIFSSKLIEKILHPNISPILTGIGKFTNGRTVFWLLDLKKFGESSFLNILLGNGFGFSFRVNTSKHWIGIWSHNDFLEVLISAGILGLLLYVYVIIRFLLMLKKKIEGKVWLSIILYFLFVAVINGVFTYPHYLFSFISLCAIVTSRFRLPLAHRNAVSTRVRFLFR